MLIDANLLLYAVDRSSPFHPTASAWRRAQLNGPRRVGIPWQCLGAFLRISTHPRAAERPLTAEQAWALTTEWLDAEVVWTPEPGDRYPDLLGELMLRHRIRGNLVSDAQLAALALEHGLTVYSTDADFALFDEVRWENPLAHGA